MAKKSLYFIALVPPEPFREQAWKLKEYFRDHYQSKASLNSPPHITLCPPFSLLVTEDKLVKAIREAAIAFKPFEVCLQNFGAFPPRVIYIDVLPQPKMNDLQLAVKKLMKGAVEKDSLIDENRPFNPHMTLAFCDLSKKQFNEAWKEFNERELAYCWLAKEFTLFRHNGNHWEAAQQISLGA